MQGSAHSVCLDQVDAGAHLSIRSLPIILKRNGERKMAYQVTLRPSVERESLIRSAINATSQRREFYDFRGQRAELPSVRLPENALVYRMENFRTFIDQKEYSIREGKPANFFLVGQENESIQQLQHDILAKLARKGVAESVVPVIDVLKTEKQREPLLITSRGVVVNGNRRLAGMRELLSESSQTYNVFYHIDCMALPEDATPDEIVDIEAALQAKPETRLDYDWIGDCQLIARLLENHKTIEAVANRLNRKPAEIKNSLAALTEAQLYLRDWAHAEGEYSRVVDAFQLFKDLPAGLEGKNQSLTEASRAIAWTLFDKRAALKERIYAFNSAFGKKAADVLDRVATSLSISLKTGEITQDDGSFSVDLEPPEQELSYEPIIKALKDPKTKEEATETLVDVCRSVLETEREAKGGGAALRAIAQISSRLKDIDIGSADPATYSAIDGHLGDIASRVSGLRTILRKLSGADGGTV
jgi:hypothetical protein